MKSYAHLEQKVYSDGKMVENKDIKMKYDGEKFAIDVRDNGHKKHIVVSKDDIMKVFSQPMHSDNLMTRLKLDFNPKITHKKKNNKTMKMKMKHQKMKRSKTSKKK